MEKNENGYPILQGENIPATDNGGCGCTDSGNMAECLDGMMPGYVYAPMQKFCMLYSTEDALRHGTLFEQLYKPTEVYGRE